MFTKDDIHALANVVIVDPTLTNLFPQFCAIQGFATSSATQTKEKVLSKPVLSKLTPH